MTKILALTAGFILLISSAFMIGGGDEEMKNKILMNLLMGRLEELHYQPQELDNEFSELAFDEFLNRMDFSKRFFTQQDLDKFDKYRTKIDDMIEAEEYTFFDIAVEAFSKRLEETEGYYKEFLAEPFDFTIEEEVELDYDKLKHAKDSEELKERWRKMLKYQTLTRLVDKLNAQDEAKENNDDSVEIKDFATLEVEAREKVMKNYDTWIKRLKREEKKDRISTYINSIVNIYDTHTGYFPPKDKEDFDIRLSGKLEGIGASLQEKDGFIQVVRIVPGSPCYMQGDLEVDDKILKVGQGAEEPTDIVDMLLGDAVQLIRGDKGTEVRLTVKKPDGSVNVIPIVRDVVLLEETYAKSALMQENGQSIGYIKLPKFYADFKNPKGRQCGKDVGIELEKLKEEGAKGVILDLRSNGGGSLQDVVNMVGHFVDKGPVVQIKARNSVPYVLKDKASGTVFDGPLVVLVNSFSASASEILAAAIQDYGRGVVIGSNTTYGKGTVQRFYNLDEFVNDDYEDFLPMGALKMTTQKFYRINGKATQHKGVVPDIILPDAYTYIETGEKEQEFAMAWDEIAPVDYDEMDLNVNALKRKSEERTSQNDIFVKLDEDAKRRKRNRDLTTHNLELDVYKSEQCQRKEESEKYKKMYDVKLDFDVTALEADLLTIADDTVKQKTNKDWIEKLEKDVYIEEAMNVIADML